MGRGQVGQPRSPGRTPLDRFAEQLALDDDGCWRWIGTISPKGYAAFYSTERKAVVSGHRWSYERFVGTVPDGLWLDHLCRVRDCVNPQHLEAVTPAENCRRGLKSALRIPQTECKWGHPKGFIGPCLECKRRCARETAARRRAAKNVKTRELV